MENTNLSELIVARIKEMELEKTLDIHGEINT